MSVLNVEMSKSIHALLELSIAGKSISLDQITEPLVSVTHIDSLSDLVEDIYLISMYHYLSSIEKNAELTRVADLIQDAYKNVSINEFSDCITYYKFLFAQVLLDNDSIDIQYRDCSSFIESQHLKKIDEFSVLGILFLSIGLLGDKPKLYQQGCLIAKKVAEFININGEIESLFFQAKGEYHKDSTRISIYILLAFSTKFIKLENLDQKLMKLDPYEAGLFQSLEIEKRLLSRCFDKMIKDHIDYPSIEIPTNLTRDYVCIEKGGVRFNTSLSDKVAVGTISVMDKVIVPSFGPHVLPLGKKDEYGFQDAICGSEEIGGQSVKMWHRMKSDSPYTNCWVYSDVEVNEKKVKVQSLLWKSDYKDDLSLVFFCRCKNIMIDKKCYSSAGLQRISINTSKIQLDFNGVNVEMLLARAAEIEVIPVAAQDFFWNSDFIVSIPFIENESIGVDFIMD